MVKLYKLSSEQLSQQDHYDFGMRALKSVLVMAGALKRSTPDVIEDVVLIRCAAARRSHAAELPRDPPTLPHCLTASLPPPRHSAPTPQGDA